MKTKNEYNYILQWHKKVKAIKLLGGKCQDCGEDRPWLLVFHHKNPEEKEYNINQIKDSSWNLILDEVLKCKLLCHNCHNKIHQKNTENDKRKQNKEIILKYKNIQCCEKCGYQESKQSLHFHHKDNKSFTISNIGIRIKSVNDLEEWLKNEIEKCLILCANCHYDLHFDKEKFVKYKNEIINWNYIERPKEVNKEKVIEMFEQGIKQIDIAKKLKCAKSTICGIIKKYREVGP